MKGLSREKVIEKHVKEILLELGHDLSDPNYDDTPGRVARFLLEFHKPFDVDKLLAGRFPADGSHAMVVQSNIPFRMVCSHHLLPAIGKASVGYIPGDYVIGLSKITRLVQAVGTEKPGLQEHINDRIADTLSDGLKAKGVIAVISAEHTCMACRGVNAPNVLTTTSAVRGVYRDVPHARAEFFELIRHNNR